MKMWLATASLVLAWTARESRADEILPASSTSECGLYLAVSSTSTADDPKWGLYAGKPIPKRSPIGYGEVAIQTFHLLANALSEESDGKPSTTTLRRSDIVDFLEQYIWVPHGSGGQFELEDSGRIVTAVPGLGVLGGCKFLTPTLPSVQFDFSFVCLSLPPWYSVLCVNE